MKVLVFMGLCLFVCLGSSELGARLAQCVRVGNNKNARFLRIVGTDVLALEYLWGRKSGRMPLERIGMGRPKGAVNKATTALKEAILASFDRLGGATYLEEVGRRDPRTYCTLLSRILPKTSIGMQDEIPVASLSDAEIRQRVAGMLREGLSSGGIETGDVVDAEAVTVKPDSS